MLPTRRPLRLLLQSAIVCGVGVMGWVSFNMLAPCEYHHSSLMDEARIVVDEVSKHVAAGGTLSIEAEKLHATLSRIPKDFVWEAAELRDGTFRVRHSGSKVTGWGFDSPWVEYHSSSRKYVCHFR